MNRFDLQKISRIRQKEAKVLLENACYSGAYYLIGYSVECALKACIAKQTKKYDFPDKAFFKGTYIHDLVKLLSYSGLKSEFEKDSNSDPDLELNWAVVKDWNETSRYTTNLTEQQAIDLYNSVSQRKNGILSWLKKRW